MKHIRQWLNDDPHNEDRCKSINGGTWCDSCNCCKHCVHDDCLCLDCGCCESELPGPMVLTTAEDET